MLLFHLKFSGGLNGPSPNTAVVNSDECLGQELGRQFLSRFQAAPRRHIEWSSANPLSTHAAGYCIADQAGLARSGNFQARTRWGETPPLVGRDGLGHAEFHNVQIP